MYLVIAILMILTGIVTLASVAAQVLSGSRGRPLLITLENFFSYLCLSTAGMGLFICGLTRLFHGAPLWMLVPILAWAMAMVRLVQTFRAARLASRPCRCCGFKMARMASGERFLSKRQEIEEKLQSREYDLWVCTCGHRELYVYPGKLAHSFRKCFSCAVTAVYTVRELITSEGVYHDTRCAACDARVSKDSASAKTV